MKTGRTTIARVVSLASAITESDSPIGSRRMRSVDAIVMPITPSETMELTRKFTFGSAEIALSASKRRLDGQFLLRPLLTVAA